MRKVVFYIAMSLDGYIADSCGNVDWLVGDGSEPGHEGTFTAFMEAVDTVILGYRTYHQIRTELFPSRWPYGGKTSYVITHRQGEVEEEIKFTCESASALVSRLKAQEGKDIWVCGGASIVNQLIGTELIDRYHITVIPTILGDGVRLFEKQAGETVLRLVKTEDYNGMVDLVYEPRS